MTSYIMSFCSLNYIMCNYRINLQFILLHYFKLTFFDPITIPESIAYHTALFRPRFYKFINPYSNNNALSLIKFPCIDYLKVLYFTDFSAFRIGRCKVSEIFSSVV